jgi:signal transduction histidine kinase
LNAIIGFCQLMEDGLPGPINALQARYLSDVLKSARHLLQLINDLLDLSKIAAGKMELRPQSFALAEAIEEVCSGVQPLADVKSIQVTRRLENAPAQAYLDTGRFKQILYNLLSNAIKFTPDRGSVAVEVDRPQAGGFSMSVRDNGIGIAPENMRRLFKEFEQLDNSVTRSHQGTGLGLALTRTLVEMQGGSIRAESEPGGGSTFIVTLPGTQVAAAEVT